MPEVGQVGAAPAAAPTVAGGPPATVGEYLLRAGRRPGGGLRFLDRNEAERWLSWGDLRRAALRVSGALQAAGIRRGDRVALVFPTGEEFFAAFFGVLLAGAAPVPLYPPVRLGRLGEYHARTARMLSGAGVRLVLAEGRIRRLLGESVAPARPELGCLTLGELPEKEAARDGAGRRDAAVAGDGAAAGDGATAAIVPAGGDDLALVQFSSGTTVEPKAVALSHRALVAQTEILGACWPDSGGVQHSCASWLPLYHDMGLIGCVFPALAREAALTLLPPEVFVTRPALWLRAISRYGATISPAPNFGYSLCLARVTDAEMDGVDLSCWRTALNGAEPVAPSVLRAFTERFARWGFSPAALTPVYGLSEAALAVTFSALDQPFRSQRFDRALLSREGKAEPLEAGRDPAANGANGASGEKTATPENAAGAVAGVEIVAVGRPLPGFALAVRGAEGQELAAGWVGRIWVRGPSLMDGYLGDPAATARALVDGWLDTGDMGFVDGGELFLTGRAKDVIILRGRNHAPADIEQAVEGLPGVRAGCAVAASWLPDDAPGEVLGLFVERTRDATAAETAALPALCRAAVLRATGLAAEQVEILAPGSLPRTSSGKLRRAEALRLYLEGTLAPPAPVSVLRLAGAMARSSIAYARLRLERRGGR